MNGPEHYERAEAILGEIGHALEYGLSDTVTGYQLAVAQVHATLALAAATAMTAGDEGMNELDFEAWDCVAGVQEDDGRTDAEIAANLNAAFGEPVEGRDYDVMPGVDEDAAEQLRADLAAPGSEADLITALARRAGMPDPFAPDDIQRPCTRCGNLNHTSRDCEVEL